MLFRTLESIFERPKPYSAYTAEELWTNQHTSQQMIEYHLNNEVEAASRNREFIKKSAIWIIKHFGCVEETHITDFGCGPGFYTDHFSKVSNHVTGIDFSRNSLNYAEKTVNADRNKVNFVHCNYLEYTPEHPLDLITMIMCDFCALSPEQRQKLLGIFSESLAPGGSILLDVYSLSAFEKRSELQSCEPNQLNGFWSANPYYGFLNTFKYDKEKVVLDKYTIVETKQTKTVYNWLQYFSVESLCDELMENGLKIVEVFSNVAGDPYDESADEFAVVIQKTDQ
jgi:SAM-dependent methyltransferase